MCEAGNSHELARSWNKIRFQYELIFHMTYLGALVRKIAGDPVRSEVYAEQHGSAFAPQKGRRATANYSDVWWQCDKCK